MKMLLEYFVFGVIAFLMTGAQCEENEVLAEFNTQAVLPCKCSPASKNPFAIVWKKGNKETVWRKQKNGLQYWGSNWTKPQRARCPHLQFERGDYSLQISNLKEEDGGVYSCRVENRDQFAENKVILRILKVSSSPSALILGNDFQISCNVTPLPYGATLRWMLNNSPFGSITRITSEDDMTKHLGKATARLMGTWTCVVSYKGKEGRASATLTAKGIIQPSRDNAKVYGALGSAVTLPCVFSRDLNPSSPDWEKLKPGSLFEPARLPASFSTSLLSSQPPFDKSARLKEVKSEDEGRYRCSAIVKGQRLTRNMQLVVAKIDRSIPSKKRDSMTLTCQLSDSSEVTNYEWVHVVYDLNGTQSVRSTQKGQTLSLNKMSEENHGEWTCRFYGKEGILGNVTYQVQLMSGLSGQNSSDPSNGTAAVVCLSLLLLVLLLVLVKMYKNYQRRKRIFQYPALETIVHSISNEREERERNREKK